MKGQSTKYKNALANKIRVDKNSNKTELKAFYLNIHSIPNEMYELIAQEK